MIHKTWTKIAALAIPLVWTVAAANAPTVSQADRQKALRYLSTTRTGVLDSVEGLSEAQWNFKPAPGRWSIAEVVEHLALTENFLNESVLSRIAQAPAAPLDRDWAALDANILAQVPDRTTRYKAPEMIAPTGRWTHRQSLDKFLAARASTIDALKSSAELRAHLVKHPAFGDLDGYQWILAVAAHSERHTKQILEVKADPNFPAK